MAMITRHVSINNSPSHHRDSFSSNNNNNSSSCAPLHSGSHSRIYFLPNSNSKASETDAKRIKQCCESKRNQSSTTCSSSSQSCCLLNKRLSNSTSSIYHNVEPNFRSNGTFQITLSRKILQSVSSRATSRTSASDLRTESYEPRASSHFLYSLARTRKDRRVATKALNNRIDVGEDVSSVIGEDSETPQVIVNASSQKPHNKITVEDLMVMIKDAEKNILLLNRVRTRALDELNQARNENEYLLGQQKVFQARIAEYDAKINLFAQTKAKNVILEEQLANLQKTLTGKESQAGEIAHLNDEMEKLKAKLVNAESKTIQVGELQGRNRSLVEKIEKMGMELEEREKMGEDLRREYQTAMERMEKEMNGMRMEMEAKEAEMEKLQEMEKEVQRLKEERDELARVLETSKESNHRANIIEERYEKVKGRLAIVEEQSAELERVRDENLELSHRVESYMVEISDLKDLMEGSNLEISELEEELEATRKKAEEGEEAERRLREAMDERSELESQLEEIKSVLLEKTNALKLAMEKEDVVGDEGNLHEERNFLQQKIDSVKDKLMPQVGKEEELQRLRLEYSKALDQNLKLEERLKKSEARVAEMEEVEKKMRELGKEVEDLNLVLAQTENLGNAAEEIGKQNVAMSERIRLLEANLKERDLERKVHAQVEEEKEVLRDQVKMLKQRLMESDSEMKAQLELYQKEVESFQSSIELLNSDSVVSGFQLPVGEMTWEFWSNLLLRIDDLMLSKLIRNDVGLELRLMAWHRDLRIRDLYEEIEEEEDEYVASRLGDLVKSKSKPGLHIIHIAAEMAPVAKVGGLADVIAGLGKALQKKGHLVEIILPKYDCMDYTRIIDLKVMEFDLMSSFDGQLYKNKIWRGIVEGLPVYFVEPLHPAKLFWRGVFYGASDDFARFTFFCRAALEFILKSKKHPDIIHSHDWQTAAVAPLYWDLYASQGLEGTKIAFTCHNFEYQGADSPAQLAMCGLDPAKHHRPDRMQDNSYPDRINLLKGAFVYSNLITTVSPTYATEVRGPEGGKGLQSTLAQHERKFHGVLNGIDFESWDPMTDPLIEYQFSFDDLNGKRANKASLKTRLGLSSYGNDLYKPLVGCITRLVPQKGVHLIRHAIYRTLEKGGQFVLLGSSPVPDIQREFEEISRKFSNHPHIRLILKYDEALSHAIYAGSDIFIIPSIFEPCGLTQLISMRYGSIPVARKTGGLADSVFDVDDPSIPTYKKNGFTFTATDEKGLNYALDRAMSYFVNDPNKWDALVANAMQMDFSWEESSERYVELYQQAILDN